MDQSQTQEFKNVLKVCAAKVINVRAEFQNWIMMPLKINQSKTP